MRLLEFVSSPLKPRLLYPFVATFLIQSFHMVEHVAQVVQKFVLGLEVAHGLIGTLDVELVHFVYNWAFFAGMALLFYFCGFHRKDSWVSGKRVLCYIFTVGVVLQGYHVLEHLVKFSQHLATAMQGTPGILGNVFNLTWLHFTINLIVYLTIAIPFFGYRVYTYPIQRLSTNVLSGILRGRTSHPRGMNNGKGYWVKGGSIVLVPEDRVREIPAVLKEHLDEQLSRERIRMKVLRAI